MEEIWRFIPDYPEYQISNLGRVVKNGEFVKQHLSNSGYLYLHLINENENKSTFIHILLVNTFMGLFPKDKKTVVDHIDNNKLNNSLDNLQVITNRQNSIKDKKPKSGHSCIYKNNKKWLVRLRIDGKKKCLGTFGDINDAILCRNEFLIKEKPQFK